jgi:4-hydroxy-4-methyl-2-oxoglutarate aldolase
MSAQLSTAHLADACITVGIPVRCGPAGLRPLSRDAACQGRVFPVRHVGSVDVFLEALENSQPGDVLVVDNGGRLDEACVGDLVTLEAQRAGSSGVVIWGLHRDTAGLQQIGLPVFSLGALPNGPLRLDPQSPDCLYWARVGSWVVTAADFVACDADGVLFIPEARRGEVVAAAEVIAARELRHAQEMQAGVSFRQQTRFAEYLTAREGQPNLTFREHLKRVASTIEK